MLNYQITCMLFCKKMMMGIKNSLQYGYFFVHLQVVKIW